MDIEDPLLRNYWVVGNRNFMLEFCFILFRMFFIVLGRCSCLSDFQILKSRGFWKKAKMEWSTGRTEVTLVTFPMIWTFVWMGLFGLTVPLILPLKVLLMTPLYIDNSSLVKHSLGNAISEHHRFMFLSLLQFHFLSSWRSTSSCVQRSNMLTTQLESPWRTILSR